MSIAHTHLTETRVRLTTSPVIRTFSVIEERVGLDYGYLRVRVELVNLDFLELAEYCVIRNDAVEVKRYRYQWMDSTQQILTKRWNAWCQAPHCGPNCASGRGAWRLIGKLSAPRCHLQDRMASISA